MKMVKQWTAKAAVIVAAISWSALGLASSAGTTMNADEALQSLMDGNKRYVENQMTGTKLCDLGARTALAKGQHPYAIILSCADSRVPPEVIFDKGLGEVFVVRVAGNVADPVVLGSIEYAVEHLGSPLIMVLGHERCGAVTAAVGANGKHEGNIGAILKRIEPAVKMAKKEAVGKGKEELVETAIDDNVKVVAADLTKQSKIIKEMAASGKVKIVGAKYDLDDGKVSVMKLK